METNENEILKNNGLKKTKHRQYVLQVLRECSQPVTAEQIYLKLMEKKDAISLSTVYRILDILISKKIVLKMNPLKEDKALFELNRRVHRHYLICIGCHKMLPIDDCPLGDYEKRLAKRTGFEITGHNLEIYGICRECREKRKLS